MIDKDGNLICPCCERTADGFELMHTGLQPDGTFLCMACVYESRGVSREVAEQTLQVMLECLRTIEKSADKMWEELGL